MRDVRRRVAARAVAILPAIALACGGSGGTGPQPPPPPPPPNTTIYFEAVNAGKHQVYSVGLDGTNLHRVDAADVADELHPSVHAGTVYFSGYHTAQAEVYSMPTSGGTITTVTSGAGSKLEPAVSSAGALAFTSDASGLPQVWLLNPACPAGCRFAPANGATGSIEAGPAWSPDGTRLVYTTTRDGAAGLYIGAADGASGTATALLSGDDAHNVEAAWSADGSQVIFASDRDTTTHQTDLYAIRVDTKAVTRLTTIGNVGQPSALHDGQIVFTQWMNGVPALRWLDPSTQAITSIDTGGLPAEHGVGEQ